MNRRNTVQRRHRVGYTRPGNDQRYSGLAGGTGVPLGHEADPLLVPGLHMTYASPLQTAIKLKSVYVWDTKNCIDPVTSEAINCRRATMMLIQNVHSPRWRPQVLWCAASSGYPRNSLRS